MDPDRRPVEGRLAVREEESAFLVVRAEDPEDWLARLEKAGDFPAREWAENMSRVCNRRLERPPPIPHAARHTARQLPARLTHATVHWLRKRKIPQRGEAVP